MEILQFQKCNQEAVVRLWNQTGLLVPQNNPCDDIYIKQAFQPELFLVGILEGQLIATVMAGYDGHRGWLNYLAVSPHLRGLGFGRDMLLAAEKILKSMGCLKVNIQIRKSNIGVMEFYHGMGFSKDEVVSMGKRLIKF